MLLFILLLIVVLSSPMSASARITPEDIYKERRAQFEIQLSKISDPAKKDIVIKADKMLNEINQKVCERFDEDVTKMAAILEELKRRAGVTETVVAFGQGDTTLDKAAYWVNYAQEAVAFQKIQDYTPQIGSDPSIGIANSQANLRSSLVGLQQKIIRAKNEVKKALK